MAWLEKKKNWLPASAGKKVGDNGKRKPGKRLYSVAEVADACNVDKKTVFKWMVFDEEDPNGAVIPQDAWFKLPNGHIRIEEWIVLELLNP